MDLLHIQNYYQQSGASTITFTDIHVIDTISSKFQASNQINCTSCKLRANISWHSSILSMCCLTGISTGFYISMPRKARETRRMYNLVHRRCGVYRLLRPQLGGRWKHSAGANSFHQAKFVKVKLLLCL